VPFKIQRVPQGLNNLLSIFGGQTPVDLEDRIRGTIELLQFYGLQQKRHVSGTNAAVAEGSSVALGPPDNEVQTKWCILFAATGTWQKTATMTALRASVAIARQSANFQSYAESELGPFGATETGAAGVVFIPPYPFLLIPPWSIQTPLKILGTDATANGTLQCEIGVLQ